MSAFFSSAETALSSVNKIRIKNMADDGNKRAATVVKLYENFDRTLSAILIGNNIVNIAAASSATVLSSSLLGPEWVPVSTAVMTILILIFGEILPKTIAKENSETVSLLMGGILSFLVTISYPVVYVFMAMQAFILNLFRKNEINPTVTEDELYTIIEAIESEGVIDGQKSQLMQSALAFDDKTADEVFTPRTDMISIDIELAPEKILDLIFTERYSRMPVFEKNIDNILGILSTKDYLELMIKNDEPPNLKRILEESANVPKSQRMLKEPIFVHKSQHLPSVLNDMKREQQNLAVVTDDFGGTMGIVTMEDLLEKLVGKIYDEDEDIEQEFVEMADGSIGFSGDISIEEGFEKLGLDWEDFDSEYNTLGGWVLEQTEEVPAPGDAFYFGSFKVTVSAMEGKRVTWLVVTPVDRSAEEEKSEEHRL